MTSNITIRNILKQGAVLTLFLLVFVQSSFGQSALKKKQDWCATDEVMERYMNNHSRMASARKRKEQEINNFVQRLRNQGQVDEYLRNVNIRLKIPVVFHVVYNDPSENISATTINNQLDRLNKDFQRLNADTTQTRSIFDSLATGIDFKFCLASEDPNGNPTNGITRTSTNHGDFGKLDSVKHTSQGGKDAWPTDEYLNIWVCRLGGFIAGYSTLPGTAFSSDDEDGIVLRYYDVGGNERALTHEAGHWFNLFHPFEDSCQGSSNTDCNTSGDYICDTPQQGSASSGCDTLRNTCTETPEYPDMVENYMSYAAPECQNMFTKGQKLRMVASINKYCRRFNLKYSNKCGGSLDSGYVSNYPFKESFERTYFPPPFWRLGYTYSKSWEEVEGIGGFGNSQNAAKLKLYSPSKDLSNHSYSMSTQKFHLANTNKPIAITFSYAYAPHPQLPDDSLFVRLDTNECGSSFSYNETRVWGKGGNELATSPATQQAFVPQPTESEWRRDTIYVNSFPTDTFKITFLAAPEGQGGNNIYVDDINVYIDTFSTGKVSKTTDPEKVVVSPNPSSDQFRLIYNQEEAKNQMMRLEVLNSVGERVLVKKARSSHGELKTSINLTDQANGFYFLKMYNKEQQVVATRKLQKVAK